MPLGIHGENTDSILEQNGRRVTQVLPVLTIYNHPAERILGKIYERNCERRRLAERRHAQENTRCAHYHRPDESIDEFHRSPSLQAILLGLVRGQFQEHVLYNL